MRILFVSLLLIISTFSYTQEKNNTQLFFDLGWFVTPSYEGAQMDYGITVDYTPGVRQLINYSPKSSLLLEATYHNVHYHLHQDENKKIPDQTINDRERFYIHVLSATTAYRYNYDNKFFDIGLNYDYNFRTVHMIKNPDTNGNDKKTFDDSIDYFSPLNFDVFIRFGFKFFSIHYNHRISDIIKNSSDLPDLPRGVLGVGVSLNTSSLKK